MIGSILNLDKKIKYIAQALLIGGFLHVVYFNQDFNKIVLLGAGLALLVLGSLFVHYPNVSKPETLFMSLILPISLVLSAILFLRFYPNLGEYFRIGVIFGFIIVYYLVLLSDNIFLVVKGREEIIPLYRVAVTWSLILIIVIAIPLFSGIFKLPVNPLYHVLFVGCFSFLFNLYQIWSSRYDEDAKDVEVGEMVLLSLVVAFFVIAATIATLFFPTEAFLRALFTASILMFGLNYISSYLKNNVSSRLLLEYFFISVLFLILLLLFTN